MDVDKIPEEWMGLDVGPKTVATFSAALAPCKTVVSICAICTTVYIVVEVKISGVVYPYQRGSWEARIVDAWCIPKRIE